MADYPTGDWYRKYLMTYEDIIMEEFKKQIMKGTPNETYIDLENNQKSFEEHLRERILKLEYLLEDTRDELQIIQIELQSILNALQNAVENGVQLNIGIVVGQTMSKLTDIIGK
jgi:hypothetical protein